MANASHFSDSPKIQKNSHKLVQVIPFSPIVFSCYNIKSETSLNGNWALYFHTSSLYFQEAA